MIIWASVLLNVDSEWDLTTCAVVIFSLESKWVVSHQLKLWLLDRFVNLVSMLLVICHLSCDVIGYEGSKCDWCFLIHLLSQRSLIVSQIVLCQLSTTVLFRTKHTQTIIFHLLMKRLLGSNLSLYILLLFSQSKPRSKPRFVPVQGKYFDVFSSS